MRLFVIGHFSKGKSTVVAALRKMRQSSTFDDRAKRLVDPDYQLTEDGIHTYHCLFLYVYACMVPTLVFGSGSFLSGVIVVAIYVYTLSTCGHLVVFSVSVICDYSFLC